MSEALSIPPPQKQALSSTFLPVTHLGSIFYRVWRTDPNASPPVTCAQVLASEGHAYLDKLGTLGFVAETLNLHGDAIPIMLSGVQALQFSKMLETCTTAASAIKTQQWSSMPALLSLPFKLVTDDQFGFVALYFDATELNNGQQKQLVDDCGAVGLTGTFHSCSNIFGNCDSYAFATAVNDNHGLNRLSAFFSVAAICMLNQMRIIDTVDKRVLYDCTHMCLTDIQESHLKHFLSLFDMVEAEDYHFIERRKGEKILGFIPGSKNTRLFQFLTTAMSAPDGSVLAACSPNI